MYDDLRAEVVYNSTLVGANLERADMRGVDLRGANLTNANLRGADLSRADFRGAILIKADLSRANLQLTNFEGADLTSADLTGSYGRRTNFSHARMWLVYLRRATMKNALFLCTDLRGADFVGTEFLGARFDGANIDRVKNADMAVYCWWWNPLGMQKISYKPIPGWKRMDESVLGGQTVQENASREQLERHNKRGWVKGEDK